MLVGQLGVGRRHPATGVSLLIPRRLAPPPALAFDFERLRADAQRLQQRLAAHDRQVAAAAPPAPRAPASKPAPWPTSSGSPSPLLSAGEQARRKRERKALEQRLLADLNAQAQVLYLPAFLRHALADPLGSLRPAPALPAGGRDCFMPNSFWQTQYEETPAGWKPKFIKGKNGKPGHWSTFNHWKNCCNTVKRMVGYNAASNDRVQIVRERGKTLVGQPRAQAGLAMLDKYMALHKPVMVVCTTPTPAATTQTPPITAPRTTSWPLSARAPIKKASTTASSMWAPGTRSSALTLETGSTIILLLDSMKELRK